LGKKLEQHGVSVWLINTGWSGGAYGTGQRMKIGYTRAMISAVMQGKLQQANTMQHPVFGMHIPLQCAHVPDEVMLPWTTWKSREEYDEQANKLAERFINNFAQYEAGVDEKIRNAAPVVTSR
jgi:phosphoenolpyruvate carboxykinase (ATP)